MGSLLATLVDCHQEGLAEQWVISLGRDMQVLVAPPITNDTRAEMLKIHALLGPCDQAVFKYSLPGPIYHLRV